MPIFEIETDQGVFEIDADREPTKAEALQAISGQLQAPTQLKASTQETLAAQEAARQAIIQSAQRGPLERISALPGAAAELGTDLLSTAIGVPMGARNIAERRGLSTAQQIAAMLQPATLASTPEGRAAAGDLIQSALEGGGRGVFDILELGRQLASREVEAQRTGRPSMVTSPILAAISSLIPSTPTEQDIGRRIEEQISSQASREVREQPMAERLGIRVGEVDPQIAEGVAQFGQVETPAVALGAKILKPLSTKVIKTIASPIKAIEEVGLRANVDSLASDFIKPTGEALTRNFIESVDSGDITRGFQSVKQKGSWNGTRDFIEKGEGRLEDLGNKINAFNKSLEKNRFEIDGSSVAQKGLTAIDDPLLLERNPEIIERIQRNAEAVNRRLTGVEVFDRLKAFNDRHEGYFKKSALGQNTALDDAEFVSDMAMRRELSKQGDNLIKGLTGIDDNFFREYGAVSELVAQAKKRYADLFVKRGQEVSRGIYGDFVKNFDLSKPLSSIRQPIQFLKGGELGRVDDVAKKISDRLPKKKLAEVLSEEDIQTRLQGISQRIPDQPPPIPQAP